MIRWPIAGSKGTGYKFADVEHDFAVYEMEAK